MKSLILIIDLNLRNINGIAVIINYNLLIRD
jgi:hypothetical protein